MTLDSRVHAQGGARGQDLGHLIFFIINLGSMPRVGLEVKIYDISMPRVGLEVKI